MLTAAPTTKHTQITGMLIALIQHFYCVQSTC
jgi:hypothetical protein